MIEERRKNGRKILSLPSYLMQKSVWWDVALADGTRPAQRNTAWLTGRGLGMAHHYCNPGVGNKAQPHANDPPPSQAGFGRAHKWNLHRGEANGSPKSIERLGR